MTTFQKAIFIIVLCIIALPSSAFSVGAATAQTHGPTIGGYPFMRPITIKGQVLCTNCRVNDIRAEQSGRNLYQLTNERGTLVFKLTWVSDRHLWRTIVWPQQLRVRSATALFEQLTAEERLRAEVKLSGFLRSSRTFDIGHLAWSASSPERFASK